MSYVHDLSYHRSHDCIDGRENLIVIKGKAGLFENEAEMSTNHQSNLQSKIFDGFFLSQSIIYYREKSCTFIELALKFTFSWVFFFIIESFSSKGG